MMENVDVFPSTKIKGDPGRQEFKAGISQFKAPFTFEHHYQSRHQFVEVEDIGSSVRFLRVGQCVGAPVRALLLFGHVDADELFGNRFEAVLVGIGAGDFGGDFGAENRRCNNAKGNLEGGQVKAGEMEGLSEADGQWAPQLNLGVPVLIPETYVPDLDVRLGLYRRLSSLAKKVELEGFAAELIDRFGALPKEVNTLLTVVRIKAMCKRASIARLDAGPRGATIQFWRDKYVSPKGLVEFIEEQRGLAKVRDNKIVVRRDWKKDSDKIKGAFAIARDLAAKAKTNV